jgi:hypothetical protein
MYSSAQILLINVENVPTISGTKKTFNSTLTTAYFDADPVQEFYIL